MSLKQELLTMLVLISQASWDSGVSGLKNTITREELGMVDRSNACLSSIPHFFG